MPSSIKDRFLGSAGALLTAHIPDNGGTWSTSATGSAATGNATLDGTGLLYNANGANASVMKSNWVPASADYAIYFDLKKMSTGGTYFNGVFGRWASVSGNLQGYGFYYNSVNAYISKLSTTGGISTVLNQAGLTIGVGITVKCRATITGTAPATLNFDTQNSDGSWTTLVTTTDSSFTAAGSAGVFLFGTQTATTCTLLSNFVAIDGAATDMLVFPANVGGAGNATMTIRGYNTAWTSGTPGTPTITISHSGDTATIISQSVTAVNLATVVVNTGLNAGTFTLSDGVESSTSTVAGSASVVVLISDVQSPTPHISLFGKWSLSTIGSSVAAVPSQTPDYQSGYNDYACEFVAFSNQATLLTNIPNGLSMYVSIDGAAPTAVVGDGTDKTITLYSIADGNSHLVRFTPPAGTKISDLTLFGSAPSLTSVAVTQAWFASNIANMQLPAAASPISVHGTFSIDTTTSGVRSQIKAGGGGYNGGTYEFATSGNAIDVLGIVVGTASQFQPTVNGIVPTLAFVPAQGDGVQTVGSKHWFPIAVATTPSLGPNIVRVVNIGSNGTETIHYVVRARTQATTSNFLASGGTALSLVSTANMVPGDWLLLGSGATSEAVQVGSVTDATHISLIGGLTASGLQMNHLSGSRVVRYAAPAATITPWNSKLYTQSIEEWGDSLVAGAQRSIVYVVSQYDPTNQFAYRYFLPLPWDTIPLGVPGAHSFDACIHVLGGTRTGNRYNNDGALANGDVPVYTPRLLDIVVIYIGTNDATLGTSASDFQHNIQALLVAATDPSVLKTYANGGRVIVFVPFTPLDYNTDPGVGGSVNSAGLHVGINQWSTDPTNYGFWLAQAVSASGVNAGYVDRVTVISVSDAIVTGSVSALGVDMHDKTHINETGHTKMGAALGLWIASMLQTPLGTRIYAAITASPEPTATISYWST